MGDVNARVRAEKGLVLKLLLGSSDPEVVRGMCDLGMQALLKILKRNVVTLRAYDKIRQVIPEGLDDVFLIAVAQEQKRVAAAVELITRMGRVLDEHGVAYVFTKSFIHYPDMGHDIDLLVLDRSKYVDGLISRYLGGCCAKTSLTNRLAGKSPYFFKDYRMPLEIHHGRMGHLGEHADLPILMMQYRRSLSLGCGSFFVPGREDQLILCALQRMYGHLNMRISDLLCVFSLIKGGALDWDYILRTTRTMGIHDGMGCFLEYVNGDHQMIMGVDLAKDLPRDIVSKDIRTRVFAGEGYYSFPMISVVIRIYVKKILVDVARLRWKSLLRLLCVPFLMVITGLRNTVNVLLKKFGQRLSL